jgi:hypothetical protein
LYTSNWGLYGGYFRLPTHKGGSDVSAIDNILEKERMVENFRDEGAKPLTPFQDLHDLGYSEAWLDALAWFAKTMAQAPMGNTAETYRFLINEMTAKQRERQNADEKLHRKGKVR